MDRFVAPQFIDVEDRIIGPITTRQFIMMVVGGVVTFGAYKLLDTSGFALTAFLVVIAVVIFGFVKINGRTFLDFLKSMIETLRRPKTRVWYKYVPLSLVMAENKEIKSDEVKTDFVPSQRNIGAQSLKDLALLVDTGGKYRGEA